jgi:hypothetical protein
LCATQIVPFSWFGIIDASQRVEEPNSAVEPLHWSLLISTNRDVRIRKQPITGWQSLMSAKGHSRRWPTFRFEAIAVFLALEALFAGQTQESNKPSFVRR